MKKDYSPSGNGRIIYNVTIKVAPSIAAQWLSWLLNDHIPEVMSTSCFTDHRVLKLLDIDEEEGTTYVIQYSACAMKIIPGT